ncbi:v-type proton ATPase subunit D [Trichonephila clavipes]|nr:v-type proton ATPase subunit D [Trichonephila clavipes]
MSGKDTIPVFPSRMAMTIMKGRLKAAQKGHGLLKRKADALQLRFRQILKKIVETKSLMGDVMKEAAFSLAEAKFTTGDFNHIVLQNVTKAQIKVRSKKDNVAVTAREAELFELEWKVSGNNWNPSDVYNLQRQPLNNHHKFSTTFLRKVPDLRHYEDALSYSFSG